MEMFGSGQPWHIGLDAQQIAAEFNYIKEQTGAPDEITMNILYNLWEKRKTALMPIERLLEWPLQN